MRMLEQLSFGFDVPIPAETPEVAPVIIADFPDETPVSYVASETPVNLDGCPQARVKLIVKMIDTVYHKTHGSESFGRVLEIWWAVLQRFTPDGEVRYMEAIKGLDRETLEVIAKGLGELMLHFCYEGRFADVLGPVYMEIASDWGKKHMGQFFTPWNVALFMAQMIIGPHEPDLDKRLSGDGEPVTMNEPCCGSGVLMLAAKGVVAKEYGRPALRRFLVYGQDIDNLCVRMAQIQMRLTDDWFMSNFLLATSGEMREAAKAAAAG